jgi:hypothetical protein
VLLLAAALLAGCGGASATNPIEGLHLAHSAGPFLTNESVYAQGMTRTKWTECDDLWGYLETHPTWSTPQISPPKLMALKSTGARIKRLGDRFGQGALGAYVSACEAMFTK